MSYNNNNINNLDNLDKNLTNSTIMSNVIKEYKNIIIKYINQENMIDLKNKNNEEYKNLIYNKFSNFKEQYPYLLDIIISGNNLNMLDDYLKCFDYLNNSKDAEGEYHQITNALGTKLHNIYVKETLDKTLNNK